MPEKNTRQELIEKFLTGYKITREDWIKLLMAYALVEEAAKNTTPATVEEVLGGSDNEKFITSFLLDYFWKTKILGTNPDSNLNDFSAVATKLKGLIADSSTNTTNTWSSQKIMETITASEAGMLTYKGQVADIAALNAIVSPKVGDTYNVLGDGNGANFTWNGTAWDELGMHIVVDNAPIQNSKNPVSSGGVFEELAKMLKKDGSIAMDNGYNPNKPQDVATKGYADLQGFLNGFHFFGGNNINWNNVEFNLNYNTVCEIESPNYTGQTNYPYHGYGQMLVFGQNTLFPMQIVFFDNGSVFYRCEYIGTQDRTRFKFSKNWRQLVKTSDYTWLSDSEYVRVYASGSQPAYSAGTVMRGNKVIYGIHAGDNSGGPMDWLDVYFANVRL